MPAGVRIVSLRMLREILKTQHERLRDYAELTTLKVLKAFAESDASVSLQCMQRQCVQKFDTQLHQET